MFFDRPVPQVSIRQAAVDSRCRCKRTGHHLEEHRVSEDSR
jgi:hypothetical protein